ncbi:MAG: carboxypeptidase regulatory-like domain-containing protein, partial [Thermoanaerobaculia bacterium]
MNRRLANWLTALVVFITAGLFLAQTSVLLAAPDAAKNTAPKFSPIQVSHSTRNVTSPPLRDYLKPAKPEATRKEMSDKLLRRGPTAGKQPAPFKPDPVAKRGGGKLMPSPIVNFETMNQTDGGGYYPPDTTMAVGPDAIVQFVNIAFQVFDKSGNSLGGPFKGGSLWEPLGGVCATFNGGYGGGDPIVMYDQLADRWFISQLAYPGPYYQCMAVSVTNDPLGSYNLYEYLYSPTDLNDYPKFGLWPDAYYMTARNFGAGFTMTVTAFDRNAMLNGQALTAIFVSLDNPAFDGLLPAYLDGIITPPANAPEILMGIGGPDSDGSPTDVIHMYQFHPDFSNPGSSTFTGPTDLDVAAYTFVPQFSCAYQPDGLCLEANGWVQYRLPYRNFGDHESLVLEHDVFNASGIVTPRWYEVRDPYGTPTVYQQGTYDPDDGVYRWMGSIAMDANNNIALGFSVTDPSATFPGIRYAGRLATDPLGDFTQGEATLIDGVGNFFDFRWGDYSTMNIDPVDDCTFWYTQEYIGQSGSGQPWQTRIGSFKFPSCTTGPRGTLTGTVTDASNGNPIAGASVSAGSSGTNTNASGVYTMLLPVGTYDMTVTKYGYLPGSAPGVVVTDGGTTTQDFALAVAPMTAVSGTVTDGSGQGWPLYATVKITGPGYPGATLYTDPLSGAYGISLVDGISYTFTVNAVVAGYNTATATLALHPSRAGVGVTQDFQLTVDATSCNAPGYGYPAGTLFEGFDSGSLPASWSVVNNSGGGVWKVHTGAEPCGFTSGNNTGGTGPYALIDYCRDYNGNLFDTELWTPSVDMSSLASATVRFNLDLYGYPYYAPNVSDVDISTDGGASWQNVFQRNNGDSERGPAQETIDISSI